MNNFCPHDFTRVSSDITDYFQCNFCGVQFTEAQIVELQDNLDEMSIQDKVERAEFLRDMNGELL